MSLAAIEQLGWEVGGASRMVQSSWHAAGLNCTWQALVGADVVSSTGCEGFKKKSIGVVCSGFAVAASSACS